MKMACGLLAVLALVLAACGGGGAPTTPTAAPTPDDPLAAAAARTTRVYPRPTPVYPRPTPTPKPIIGSMEYYAATPTPTPTPRPAPVRVSGIGWGQRDIALPGGVYDCRVEVRGNMYWTWHGELRAGVALFGIYADGKFVTLIDGERGTNITRSAVVRVRGGVY